MHLPETNDREHDTPPEELRLINQSRTNYYPICSNDIIDNDVDNVDDDVDNDDDNVDSNVDNLDDVDDDVDDDDGCDDSDRLTLSYNLLKFERNDEGIYKLFIFLRYKEKYYKYVVLFEEIYISRIGLTDDGKKKIKVELEQISNTTDIYHNYSIFNQEYDVLMDTYLDIEANRSIMNSIFEGSRTEFKIISNDNTIKLDIHEEDLKIYISGLNL